MSTTQPYSTKNSLPTTTFLPQTTQTSSTNSSTTNTTPLSRLPFQIPTPAPELNTQNCSYIISTTPSQYSHAIYTTLIQPCHDPAPSANLVNATISPSSPHQHPSYTYLWAVGLAIIALSLITCGLWRLARSVVIYHVAQRKCVQARRHKAVENYVMGDLEHQTPSPHHSRSKDRRDESGRPTVRHVAPSNEYSGLFSGWRRGAPEQSGQSSLEGVHGSEGTESWRQGSRAGESLGSEFLWSQVFGSAFWRGRVVARSRDG